MLSPQGRAPAGKHSQLGQAIAFATQSSWRVLPAIYGKLAPWLVKAGAPAEALADLECWRTSVELLARVQNRHVLRFTAALEAEGIPYCLLKGAALKWLAYDHPWERSGWDIDVAISADFMERGFSIALDQGYIPAEGYQEPPWFRPANPDRYARVPTEHHELGFLARRFTLTDATDDQLAAIRRQVALGRTGWEPNDAGQAIGYVNLDLHFGLSQEMPVELLIATAQVIDVGGQTVRVPSPAWALLHLIFKLYWEGVHDYRKGGYQYADLTRLAPTLTAEDVEEYRPLMAAWRMEAATYFTLRRLPDAFGVELPAPLRELVAEAATPLAGITPGDQNDLGDMWDKLWGGR
jgi:hypothetical protein